MDTMNLKISKSIYLLPVIALITLSNVDVAYAETTDTIKGKAHAETTDTIKGKLSFISSEISSITTEKPIIPKDKLSKIERLKELKAEQILLQSQLTSAKVYEINALSQSIKDEQLAEQKAKAEAEAQAKAKAAAEEKAKLEAQEKAKAEAEQKAKDELNKSTQQNIDSNQNISTENTTALQYDNTGILVESASTNAQQAINLLLGIPGHSNGASYHASTGLDTLIDGLSIPECVYVIHRIEGAGFGQTGSGYAGIDNAESHEAFVRIQVNNRFGGDIKSLLKSWGTYAYGGY